MNFRTRRGDHPELNLIPMIDVLIVLLIFLVLTTTFRHESALRIKLPDATSHVPSTEKGIDVSIGADARIAVNEMMLPDGTPESLRKALAEASGGRMDGMIIIRADQQTPHRVVMAVLDVASGLGFKRITFATRERPREP